MTLRTAAGMVVLLMLSSGCAARHGRPIVGGSTVPNPTGTISGNVTTTGGTPLEGRRVSAINMATEAHFDATTASNGGYTIKVPPGRYRLELELRGGDQIARQPEQTNVNVGDVDDSLNFVIR
ncbi:MAG TPA: carboxypeptidase-like regulatory domain-containing protein [Vicinamibacterales bacterium]